MGANVVPLRHGQAPSAAGDPAAAAVPTSALTRALRTGVFTVTAELGPPRDPDPQVVRDAARALQGCVHAVNVTDNQAATVKLSPLAASTLLIEEGLEPILQLTGRDRNLMALQADLLGAWTLGVRGVMLLTGDPLHVGPYESLASRVGDVDGAGLTRLVRGLNAGRLAAGEPLELATDFLIAGAANPLVDATARIEGKVDGGVDVLQTNIVYDVPRFAEWLAPFVESGLAERAPFLVGVCPPRSSRMLEHLHDRIPGVEVDDETFARMAGRAGDAALDTGIEIAAELVDRLRELPGVAGVHLMAPGWEGVAVPAVVARAGVEPGSAA